MRYAGAVVDSDLLGDWPELIGKFIVNFGMIEQLTIEWLDLFGLVDEFEQSTCFERLVELRRQINACKAAPKGLRSTVVESMLDVERLLKIRNRIAHGPLVMIYRGGDESKPPSKIGHYNRRHASRSDDTVSLIELKRSIDQAVTIAQRLDKRLPQMREHHPHQVPTVAAQRARRDWLSRVIERVKSLFG